MLYAFLKPFTHIFYFCLLCQLSTNDITDEDEPVNIYRLYCRLQMLLLVIIQFRCIGVGRIASSKSTGKLINVN